MDPEELTRLTRRDFLTTTASGLGLLAFASMLKADGLLAAEPGRDEAEGTPLAPRMPHFAPKAKACIFIYMAGAPSQLDLFDPKPKLNELSGQKLPDSMTRNVRFAFHSERLGAIDGDASDFPPLWRERDGVLRFASEDWGVRG